METEQQIAELAVMIEEGFSELREDMNKRFDGLERRMVGVETRLADVEARLTDVERRFNRVEDAFEKLVLSLDSHFVEITENAKRIGVLEKAA